MEGEGGSPLALSLLTASPRPLRSTSRKRTRTHTPSSPEVLEKGPGGGTWGGAGTAELASPGALLQPSLPQEPGNLLQKQACHLVR